MSSHHSTNEVGVVVAAPPPCTELLQVGADSRLYEFKEQLLLLTTLVASATYVAGLNLPAGSWQQDDPANGHLAGDPIFRDTHYGRYLAFYYCNATALASSVVVCLILVMLREKRNVWTLVLRAVMVLDLLGLMGSYAAGSCEDAFTSIYAGLLACPILAYITYASVCYIWVLCRGDGVATNTNLERPEKEKTEVLMPLATVVVTISYAAGLNPPGGFWSSTMGVQVAGKPIMQVTGPRRYRAFFMCNTAAFVASLLIILLLLDKKLDKKLNKTISRRFTAVYTFIVVALLGLMGAYAAGSCREADNTFNVLSLAVAVPACVCLQLALAYLIHPSSGIKDMLHAVSEWCNRFNPADTDPRMKNTRFFVMVLASLAVSITYQAGLDPPGGLWQDDLGGHKIGHPVLLDTHPARYQVFFYSNSAAFVTSLVVVMMVQSRFLLRRRTLLAALVLDLIGLVVAYAAGSTRDASTSIYVVAMPCLVLSYTVIHIALGGEKEQIDPPPVARNAPPLPAVDVAIVAAPTPPTPTPTPPPPPHHDDDAPVVDVAIVAAPTPPTPTPTPPPPHHDDDAPVVDVAIVAAPTPPTPTPHYHDDDAPVVDVAIVAAPTPPTPIPTPPHHDDDAHVLVSVAPVGVRRSKEQLEDKRQVLLLIAILVATLTYQAGLTPPGGFWQADDDNLGRRAGYPVLLEDYPRFYKTFFYCNGASFMASVALILLLVNRKLYRPAIRCYALHVCMAVGMFALMGAYAAGSSRHLKTSIYVLTLLAAVSTVILLKVVIFWYIRKRNRHSQDATTAVRRRLARGHGGDSQEKNEVLEYLMLLGVLIASVTYQTGLKPPGGMWQDDNTVGGTHYFAGNPVLHDVSQLRYTVFFYSNSASFMASIIVIITLLPLTLAGVLPTKLTWPLWPVHSTIVMDMLALLVAYAAGSTRKWESSRNVIFLILPVLTYIALYAVAAAIYIGKKTRKYHGTRSRPMMLAENVMKAEI